VRACGCVSGCVHEWVRVSVCACVGLVCVSGCARARLRACVCVCVCV